jgi:hypothetical protein
MTVLMDFQDRAVRLTEERQQYIAGNEDADRWKKAIGGTLRKPTKVTEAFHHPKMRMFYRIYSKSVDDHNFYVVVKVRGYDMLVVTAFFGKKKLWGTP